MIILTLVEQTSGGRSFQIFARDYENALILVKFAPWWTSSLNDDSTTIHELPSEFRSLNSDGTLHTQTKSIVLRNGEGAILIK